VAVSTPKHLKPFDFGRSQSLTINQYLLFSWSFYYRFAVNFAVVCFNGGFGRGLGCIWREVADVGWEID
jgi:hypothetical protein